MHGTALNVPAALLATSNERANVGLLALGCRAGMFRVDGEY